MWEVGEGSISAGSVREVHLGKDITHGQDRIDTIEIPMIIAALTRYDMRYAVTTPPHIIPIHI